MPPANHPPLFTPFDIRSPTNHRLTLAIGIGYSDHGYVRLDAVNTSLAERLAALALSGTMAIVEFADVTLIADRLHTLAAPRKEGDALFLVCNCRALAEDVSRAFEWADIYLSWMFAPPTFPSVAVRAPAIRALPPRLA